MQAHRSIGKRFDVGKHYYWKKIHVGANEKKQQFYVDAPE